MPKKKKTDETPVPSTVETASENVEIEEAAEVNAAESDISAEATPIADETDNAKAEAVEDVPAKEAPRKRGARKKDTDSTDESESLSESEAISEPAVEEENPFDNEDNFVLDAEEILAELKEENNKISDENKDIDTENVISNLDTEDLSEMESDIKSEDKTAVELAQELKALSTQRIDVNESPSESNEGEAERTSSRSGGARSNSSQRRAVANFFDDSSELKIVTVEGTENMIRSELTGLKVSGIPLFCKIIGSKLIDGEIFAICKPMRKKFEDSFVYVPFTEMDIFVRGDITDGGKRQIINLRLNQTERVTITDLDANKSFVIGSIRMGNMRTRRIAYFTGSTNRRSGRRMIVGKGTVIRDAYVEQITQNGITVNACGAHAWIPKKELSHEYLDHPRKEFKIGQLVDIKVLDLVTDAEHDYRVMVTASVKALKPNKTIEALNAAEIGGVYTGTVAVLPNSNSGNIIVNADCGFKCTIGRTPEYPFTVGSKVTVELISKNKEYGYGRIVRVLEYGHEKYVG